MKKSYLFNALAIGASLLVLGQTGSASDALRGTGQQEAKQSEDQEPAKPKVEISGPLGSRTNPVRCEDPKGERQYLNRLRCPNDMRPTYSRMGSFGPGPYGNILDGYEVKCEDSEDVSIFMDMYHDGYAEKEAVPGFTIVKE